MRASEPRTSVLKGSIEYIGSDGTITIPVFMYRKDSEIRNGGVEFHKYHKDCDGRIQYRNFCPGCDKILFEEEIVKRADFGGEAVEADRDTIKSALKDDLDSNIQILGTIPKKDVIDRITSNVFSFHATYMVRGFKTGTKKKEVMPSSERQLRLVLDSLGKNGEVMYVRVPLSSGARFGLLFPTGDLYTLYYQEEIRRDIQWNYETGEGYSKDELAGVKAFLKSKEVSINETPSMAEMLTKVEEILSEAEASEPKTVSEDGPASVINVAGLMENLIKSVEESKKR
jgi:non-homologous end joining protein Ku